MSGRAGSKGGGGVVTPPGSPSLSLLAPPKPATPQPRSPQTPRSRAHSRERGSSRLSVTTAATTTTTTTTPVDSATSTTTATTTTTRTTPTIIYSTHTTPPSSQSSSPTSSQSTKTSTTTTTTRTTTLSTPRSPTTTHTTTTNTTTHLSPWTGHNFNSSSGHKKNSTTADSRLVVLGVPAVGKSALVVRLLTGRFIWEYDPTLEAAYRHQATVDDDPALMDILDTAGQADGWVSEGHARWGEGFLLAFSVTDRASFSAVPALHAALHSHRHHAPFSSVIVANKTDLGHLAEVTEEEAGELAGELGVSLFLTSACDGGPAITAAFAELHRDVVRRRWSRRRRSSAKTVIEGFYKMFSR